MQLSKPDPTVPTGMVEYRDPTTSPSCFVAGTLVHTKDGLKPIEQIKVGDYVLSKPDSGVGEQEYKRVTETFVRDGQDIWLVQYIVSGEKTSRALVVTGNHPIWKEHVGWTTVNNLKGGMAFAYIAMITMLGFSGL